MWLNVGCICSDALGETWKNTTIHFYDLLCGKNQTGDQQRFATLPLPQTHHAELLLENT